jgi:pimeloyl-ACP methyl ester carboxylesterase
VSAAGRNAALRMERIEFSGPTGLRMVGRLTHSDRARAVVMLHPLLADKDAGGLFSAAAHALRERGWGALCFDLGGHGESDDRGLTGEHVRRDASAALALMRSLGHRDLVLWTHGTSAHAALAVCKGVRAVVITDGSIGSSAVDWQVLLRTSTPDRRGRHALPLQRTSAGAWRQVTVHQTLLDELDAPLPACSIDCAVLVQVPAQGSALAQQVRALGQVERLRLCVAADVASAVAQGVDWIAGARA